MGNVNKKILDLFQSQDIITLEELKNHLGFSERKVREFLSELRDAGDKNGFQIITVSKRGYFLQIIDDTKYQSYLHQFNNDFQQFIAKKEYRISLILFLLLQNTGFISINQIAEILDVSRSTVINDMNDVKKELKHSELHLESRSHYGIRVSGNEKNIRQMLSRISRKVIENQNVHLEFFEFIEKLDFGLVTDHFISLLNEYNIIMTNNAIESILFHLKILIYRILQKNYINEIKINKSLIDIKIFAITKELLSFIENQYSIQITNDEIDLVASQIFGKASSEMVPLDQKMKLAKSIREALIKVDKDFDTNFSEDTVLKENLLLHLHPLIMRVTYGLTLSDSLVKSVSVQYMNAFLVAMRFIDYHEELNEYQLSRDEIGYLALHFATHIERENQAKMQSIKKIVFIADSMKSSTLLIKTKIQSYFPLANIMVIPHMSVAKHDMEEIELIISTEPVCLEKGQNKVVVIHQNLDEKDFHKIKNEIIFSGEQYTNNVLGLQDLFYEDLFWVVKNGDYLDLITKMCERMVDKGYAKQGFKDSVLEREKRFSTVYDTGIASPHSLQPMGNIDSVGIVLLEKPTVFHDKEVKCIFVINVKKGHLLLHQEISDFLIKLMNDSNKIKQLELINTYQKLRVFLKEFL